MPRTLSDLRAISGVGDKKLAEFGAHFLRVTSAADGPPDGG